MTHVATRTTRTTLRRHQVKALIKGREKDKAEEEAATVVQSALRTLLAQQEIAQLQAAKQEGEGKGKRNSGFKALFRSKAKDGKKTTAKAKPTAKMTPTSPPPSLMIAGTPPASQQLTTLQREAEAEAELFGPYAEIEPDVDAVEATHAAAAAAATDAPFLEEPQSGDGNDGSGGEPAFGEAFEVTLVRQLDDDMHTMPFGFDFICRKASLLGRGNVRTCTGCTTWFIIRTAAAVGCHANRYTPFHAQPP